MTIKNNLCLCNRCWVVMHDENPCEESYDFSDDDLKSLEIEDQARDNDGCVVCPICEDDGTLFDITSMEQLQQFLKLKEK